MKSLHNIITEGIFDIDIDLSIYNNWLKNNVPKSSGRLIDKIKFNTKGEIEWPGDGLSLDIKEPAPSALKFADNKKLVIVCNVDSDSSEIDLGFLPNTFKKLSLELYKPSKLLFSSKHIIPRVQVEQNDFDMSKVIQFDFKKLTCKYFDIWVHATCVDINELKWPSISKQCKLTKDIITAYWKANSILKLDVPEIKLYN